MSTTPEGFPDMMGNPIHTGDFIVTVYDEYDHLYIAKVTGWTNKFMKIEFLTTPKAWRDKKKRKDPDPKRFMKVSEEDVTMYMLKHQR